MNFSGSKFTYQKYRKFENLSFYTSKVEKTYILHPKKITQIRSGDFLIGSLKKD